MDSERAIRLERIFLLILAFIVIVAGYFWYQSTQTAPSIGPIEKVATGPNADIPTPPSFDPQKLPTPQSNTPAQIEARHVLIQYKGSARARGATRTKEEAKARAEKIRDLARGKDIDFATLAQYTDEPRAPGRPWTLGSFTPDRMVKPFSDAAFRLGIGQISDVVETPFGFHVIQRTK